MAGDERGPTRLALSSLPGAPPARLHLLPCSVEHDGAAPVQRFFAPAIRHPREAQPEPGQLDDPAVSFRGRSLKGKQVSLPEGYVGLVVEEDVAPFSVSEEHNVRVKSTFESLTVWNLERAPDSNDKAIMALGWPKIAEGIHAPVAEEVGLAAASTCWTPESSLRFGLTLDCLGTEEPARQPALSTHRR